MNSTVAETEKNRYLPAIALVAAVLGFLFDYLFFEKIPGISVVLYVGLILAGVFGLAAYFKRNIGLSILWLVAPLLFFASMVFVRASYELVFFNILACIYLLLLIAKTIFAENLKSYGLANYIKTIFAPFRFLRKFISSAADLAALGGNLQKHNKRSQEIKGIVLAIPVLLIFIILFASADLVFQKLITEFVSINLEPDTPFRIILSAAIAAGLMGAYSFIFLGDDNRKRLYWPEKETAPRTVGTVEITVFLGLISALFLIFILIQLSYLFGGGQNITELGFTYSEYARRGFFELIVVAAFSFLIILAADKYTERKNNGHSIFFKTASLLLSVVVIVIMASALKRLSLYEQAYGFTTDRLYSHIIIFFIAAIFALLVYKIFKNEAENKLAARIFVLAILFFAFVNLMNPEDFIARKNIARFKETGKIDTAYLGQLSPDAAPEMLKILDWPGPVRYDESNNDLKKRISDLLYSQRKDLESKTFTNWQSLNLARTKARDLLKNIP